MKHWLLTGALLFSLALQAQTPRTIEIGKATTTYIKIKGTRPSDLDIGGMDSAIARQQIENQPIFKLIALRPFQATNMLIIAEDTVFDVSLVYKEKPTMRYIELEYTGAGEPERQRGGNAAVKSAVVNTAGFSPAASQFKKVETLEKNQHLSKLNDKVYLLLDNIAADKEYVYFKFRVRNSSRIDYNISYLQFTVQTARKGLRATTNQEITQEAAPYLRNIQNVESKETGVLIYALQKFALRDDEVLSVVLSEESLTKNGRKVSLKVTPSSFRNVNSIK